MLLKYCMNLDFGGSHAVGDCWQMRLAADFFGAKLVG
jgi:hypothetical protein